MDTVGNWLVGNESMEDLLVEKEMKKAFVMHRLKKKDGLQRKVTWILKS